MLFGWTEQDREYGSCAYGDRDDTTITTTRLRLVGGVSDAIPVEARPAALPFTGKVVKTTALEKHYVDAGYALRTLRSGGPGAGNAFHCLGLDRATIGRVLHGLENSLRHQSTFLSIICRTQFEYFESGELPDTLRMILKGDKVRPCGTIDGLEHLLMRAGMGGDVPTEGGGASASPGRDDCPGVLWAPWPSGPFLCVWDSIGFHH